MASGRYSAIDLGTLPGGTVSLARGINNAGLIVGEADVGGAFHAFAYVPPRPGRRWAFDTGMTDIGASGTRNTFARAVSDTGVVTGFGETDAGAIQALVWFSNGGLLPLGGLGGAHSFALGISSAQSGGQTPSVAGFRLASDGAASGFVWQGGATREVGTLGGAYSAAGAANSMGQWAGDASLTSGDLHAFLYDNGTMLDLGTLGGHNSSAKAMNDQGRVVGCSDVPGGATNAFLFSGGPMQNLGTLGGADSCAWSVNAAGQVVGAAATAAAAGHAFLYDGQMHDLNNLLSSSGWDLLAATGINDAGQIVGYGLHNNLARAFLLNPL